MHSLLVTSAILIGIAAPAAAQDFDLMQMADTNSDKKVSLEEFTTFQNAGWQFAGNGAEKLKPAELDPMMKPLLAGIAPDAEGYVSHAAFTAAVPARYKAADKNGDGSLDEAELKTAMGAP